MFGADAARAAELRSILASIVQDEVQHKGKEYAGAGGLTVGTLAQLHGKSLMEAIPERALKRIVETSAGAFVCLPFTNAAERLSNQSQRDMWSKELKWEHLTKPVLIIAYLPGHFILLSVDHSSRTVTICDSLPKAAPGSSRHKDSLQLANNVIAWLAESHMKKCQLDHVPATAVPPAPVYTAAFHSDSLPKQADGTSCGAFAAASAYFLVHHGRLPTTADFTGADSTCLRLAVLDMCIRGAQKPIVAGGAGAGAGAGARAAGGAATRAAATRGAAAARGAP